LAPVPLQAFERVCLSSFFQQVVRRFGNPDEHDEEQHRDHGRHGVQRFVRHRRPDNHFEQETAAELYGEYAAQSSADVHVRYFAQEHWAHRVRYALTQTGHEPGHVQRPSSGHEQRQHPGNEEQWPEDGDAEFPADTVHQVSPEQRANDVSQVHEGHYPRQLAVADV